MPPKTPEVASIVPTAVLLLVQVPPETELESVEVSPVHRLVEPEIVPAVGAGFTVTGVSLRQPVESA
jgi:hypothetical protein